jgi:hypothetical protein
MSHIKTTPPPLNKKEKQLSQFICNVDIYIALIERDRRLYNEGQVAMEERMPCLKASSNLGTA